MLPQILAIAAGAATSAATASAASTATATTSAASTAATPNPKQHQYVCAYVFVRVCARIRKSAAVAANSKANWQQLPHRVPIILAVAAISIS